MGRGVGVRLPLHGIEFVESAPEGIQAVCVGYFHHGLFEFADAGRFVRRFELTVYDANGALPEERDLPLDDYQHHGAALMLLVERLTGIQSELSWFTGPYPHVWQVN